MSNLHLSIIEILNSLFQGDYFCTVCQRRFLKGKMGSFELLWIMVSFIWKIIFRLWSLVGFQERIETPSSSEKVQYLQQLNISKLERCKPISLFDPYWFNPQFINENRQQIPLYWTIVRFWVVEAKECKKVATKLQVILQIKNSILLCL